MIRHYDAYSFANGGEGETFELGGQGLARSDTEAYDFPENYISMLRDLEGVEDLVERQVIIDRYEGARNPHALNLESFRDESLPLDRTDSSHATLPTNFLTESNTTTLSPPYPLSREHSLGSAATVPFTSGDLASIVPPEAVTQATSLDTAATVPFAGGDLGAIIVLPETIARANSSGRADTVPFTNSSDLGVILPPQAVEQADLSNIHVISANVGDNLPIVEPPAPIVSLSGINNINLPESSPRRGRNEEVAGYNLRERKRVKRFI